MEVGIHPEEKKKRAFLGPKNNLHHGQTNGARCIIAMGRGNQSTNVLRSRDRKPSLPLNSKFRDLLEIRLLTFMVPSMADLN